jgi:hypothetical protein
MIDDKVEADLGQRDVKFISYAVDRARDSGQVRAQINDWNHLVGHQILLLSKAQGCSENSVISYTD